MMADFRPDFDIAEKGCLLSQHRILIKIIKMAFYILLIAVNFLLSIISFIIFKVKKLYRFATTTLQGIWQLSLLCQKTQLIFKVVLYQFQNFCPKSLGETSFFQSMDIIVHGGYWTANTIIKLNTIFYKILAMWNNENYLRRLERLIIMTGKILRNLLIASEFFVFCNVAK